MTRVRCPQCGNTEGIHLILKHEQISRKEYPEDNRIEVCATQTLALKCPECEYEDTHAIYPDARDFEPWLDNNRGVRIGRESHEYHPI